MSGAVRLSSPADHTERLIRGGSLLLGLGVACGLAWVVWRSDDRALGMADRFLLRRGPTSHGSVLSLRHSGQGQTWSAWAACYASAQPMALKDGVVRTLRPVGAAGLSLAAGQLRLRFGPVETGDDTGSQLAAALPAWPSAAVWLDTRSGALLALDQNARQACLLVSNALASP